MRERELILLWLVRFFEFLVSAFLNVAKSGQNLLRSFVVVRFQRGFEFHDLSHKRLRFRLVSSFFDASPTCRFSLRYALFSFSICAPSSVCLASAELAEFSAGADCAERSAIKIGKTNKRRTNERIVIGFNLMCGCFAGDLRARGRIFISCRVDFHCCNECSPALLCETRCELSASVLDGLDTENFSIERRSER